MTGTGAELFLTRTSLEAAKARIGFVSFLRSALVLPPRPAGDAGDEVQRICDEKLEFRARQRVQRQ
jgi:hypothetical protein